MMVFTRVERKDRNCRRKWQKKRAKVKKKLRDLNSSTMLHKVVMKVKRKSGNSGNTESGGEKEVVLTPKKLREEQRHPCPRGGQYSSRS